MNERIYACISNSAVANTVIGDESFVAMISPEYDDVIEVTDMTPRPSVGWIVTSDGLRPVSPFPSWVWNGTTYDPPVPRPEDGQSWAWDEQAVAWVLVEDS